MPTIKRAPAARKPVKRKIVSRDSPWKTLVFEIGLTLDQASVIARELIEHSEDTVMNSIYEKRFKEANPRLLECFEHIYSEDGIEDVEFPENFLNGAIELLGRYAHRIAMESNEHGLRQLGREIDAMLDTDFYDINKEEEDAWTGLLTDPEFATRLVDKFLPRILAQEKEEEEDEKAAEARREAERTKIRVKSARALLEAEGYIVMKKES